MTEVSLKLALNDIKRAQKRASDETPDIDAQGTDDQVSYDPLRSELCRHVSKQILQCLFLSLERLTFQHDEVP
ncbi:hypothetical protein [Microvirga sp. VF16]|uniref:hypothetical protein n=1 Tax=Microvirga sp. VF16 TaxID=2807101 RepID=UPI00193E957A|nr:hypothetical protein [Microvirga sp. VF16]QRM30326.1 hypothetical protein JO965_04730 [Microvirga sp. VF16]